MKKRLISALLALLLCLALLPSFALADDAPVLDGPPVLVSLELIKEGDVIWAEAVLETPPLVQNSINVMVAFGKEDVYGGFEFAVSVDGGGWQTVELVGPLQGDRWNGRYRIDSLSLAEDSQVSARVRYCGVNDNGKRVYSAWSDTVTASLVVPGVAGAEEEDFIAHDWAKPELIQATVLGLIPASLQGADLTLPITRAEFAAVSVKAYEALSGLTAKVVWINPFVDTRDDEVLKAVNLGITNGVSATEFAPDALLNREQAATMLARVYKKAFIPGWTLDDDAWFVEQFRGSFTMPETFADDGDISAWARDSVYFMAANGIIKGMEGGTFQPRAVTAEQQAAGYAQATREQAILIAVRMVKNLKQ